MLSRAYKYIIWSLIALMVGIGVSISVYHHNTTAVYLFIAYTVIVSIVAMLGKINSKYFPLIILGISAGLVLQTTMYGSGAIGTDAQMELVYMKDNALYGYDISNWHLYNTSVVTSLFAPALIRLGLEPVWFIKLVAPMFLIFVPFVLYFVFRRFTSYRIAYLSILFFMAMPTFSIGVTTIAKQEIAELFFVLLLLIMVTPMKTYKQIILMTLLLLLTFVCHYTIGIIGIMLIGASFAVALVYKIVRRYRKFEFLENNTVKLKSYLIVLLICVTFACVWIIVMSDGIIFEGIFSIINVPANMAYYQQYTTDSNLISLQESPIQSAIGLDFLKVSITGKIFRILQYATEILICVGFIGVIFIKRLKKFSSEFVVCSGCCLLALSACVIIPRLSMIMGIARIYHVTLFLLSPMLIIGIVWVFKRYHLYVASFIVIMYFIFTSGVVFELTKDTTTNYINVPYSIALSNTRLNLVGIFSDSDRACAEWLEQNAQKGDKIVADDNSLVLLRGYVRDLTVLFDRVTYNPYNMSVLPENSYLFLTEWNIEENKIVRYNGYGMRSSMPIPDATLLSMQTLEIVYQNGNSVIYHKGK